MVIKLAHICFVVEDLEKSTTFYTEALGFEKAFDFINDDGELFGRYFSIGGGTFLELFIGKHDQRDDSQSYKHLCLQVEDINAEVANIKAAGVDVGPVKLGSDKSWQAWLEDPDGNRIELHQYTPESKQAPFIK